jgi:hypothetical protein
MLKLAKTILLSLCICGSALADVLTIKDDAPSQYVVKKGDTLWDISGMYLNSPWRWPELWGKNPQIDNPHLIYPGDVLRLVYGADGKPRLMVASGPSVVKVSPSKRTTNKRYQPVETLPLKDIMPYLHHERILMGEEFDAAPMVLGGNHNTARKIAGDLIYVKGELQEHELYGIYKKKFECSGDVDDQKIYELELVATARVITHAQNEDVYKVRVLTSRSEVKLGDKILPLASDLSLPVNYTLTKPVEDLDAEILGGSIDIREYGKYDVVILNAGSEDGLETGNVVGVYAKSPEIMMQKGKPVYAEDASAYSRLVDDFNDKEKLVMPNENSGHLVVFKVYDKFSYALVTENSFPVRRGDKVGAPVSISIK